MKPVDVLLGLFFVIGGMILGHTLRIALEEEHNKRRDRREWEQRKQKELDIT